MVMDAAGAMVAVVGVIATGVAGVIAAAVAGVIVTGADTAIAAGDMGTAESIGRATVALDALEMVA